MPLVMLPPKYSFCRRSSSQTRMPATSVSPISARIDWTKLNEVMARRTVAQFIALSNGTAMPVPVE